MGIVVGTVVGMVVGTVVGWDWIVVVLGGRREARMPRLSWCLSRDEDERLVMWSWEDLLLGWLLIHDMQMSFHQDEEWKQRKKQMDTQMIIKHALITMATNVTMWS